MMNKNFSDDIYSFFLSWKQLFFQINKSFKLNKKYFKTKIILIVILISSTFVSINQSFQLKDDICYTQYCKKQFENHLHTASVIFGILFIYVFIQTLKKFKHLMKLAKPIIIPLGFIPIIIYIIINDYMLRNDISFKTNQRLYLILLFIKIALIIFFAVLIKKGQAIKLIKIGKLAIAFLILLTIISWILSIKYYLEVKKLKRDDVIKNYSFGSKRIYPLSFVVFMVTFSSTFILSFAVKG